jgi:hypothetical protein
MSNFISDPIFRSEINKHFFNNNNVHDAVQTLNQTIHTLMQNTFAELLKTESESKTWDKLSEVVVETWTSHLEQSLKTLREHNQLTLEAECAQMFTLNHYYEETLLKIKRQAKELVETPEVSDDTSERKKIMQRAQNLEQEHKLESGFIARYSEQAKTDAKELSVLELQVSLHCYSKVMTKRLNDNVALMARLLLINKPHEQLYDMMLALKDNTLKQALAEDASTVKKRKRHERAKAHLVKAQNTLRRFY